MMKIMSKTGFMTAVATAIAAAASAAAQISSGYYLYASPQDTTNGTSFPNTFYNIVSFWKGSSAYLESFFYFEVDGWMNG